ncbi:MAG: heme-binding protein [Alphaproteobacteria bacterium]
MTRLTTDEALAIITAARAYRRASGAPPLAYAVVDDGGHLLAVARDESAGRLRAEIAINKAWSAAVMGFSTETLARQTTGYENWFASLQGAAGGRLFASAGGLRVRRAETVIGAFAVAGGASAEDVAVARQAIEAAGLAIAEDTHT